MPAGLCFMLFCPKLSCVQWSVNGGQEQIDCGRSRQGCASEVLSGILAVITRNFINDVGSEVMRRLLAKWKIISAY